MKKILLLLMVVFILIGCENNKVPQNVESSEIIETVASTIIPEMTPEPTVEATSTPEIEKTPEVTPIPEVTKTPEASVNPDASKKTESTESKPKAVNKSGSTVYVGKTGTKYHNKDCPSLKGKGIAISYDEALKQDRQPCKICQ